ncbi:hypothetical protein E9Q_01246 [Moraxella catarrhalis BC1]|nr:hypothetical protein E9U_09350 [Moraxella catarrhalis BC8]EGE19979.1 hypothetical protein E9Q_01246 [Moraxella catarrhalis BC1]EGE20056.1 hypothetical protein E9S_06203 [Moraxella catarrhalis BC7]
MLHHHQPILSEHWVVLAHKMASSTLMSSWLSCHFAL